MVFLPFFPRTGEGFLHEYFVKLFQTEVFRPESIIDTLEILSCCD